MKVLRFIGILLLQAYVISAVADSIAAPLASISHELVVSDSVQGDFRQEKYLSFVDTPFVSTGHFRLEREAGLLWQVVEPLESTMIVKEGRVTLDGKRVDDQGIGRLITTVMLGLMEGKLSELNETFDITTDTVGEDWSILLTPRSTRLRAAIEHIRIQGKQYLSAIEIVDAESNRTLMQFTNVSSAAERTILRAESAQ